MELGEAGRALRAAEAADTTGLSAERQARMLIDVARAHAQRRQADDAAAALIEAERITPEQVRSHYLTRQIVSDLLTMQAQDRAAILDAMNQAISRLYAYETEDTGGEGDQAA